MTRFIVLKRISNAILGRPTHGPQRDRPWRVWDLDSELRYLPVVARFPSSALPICEVGSGPQGIACWTTKTIIGVDPGADERHGPSPPPPPNFQRVLGDGANIPLADRSVAAAVAVDTFEHIPAQARPAVVREMVRVTADGGRIILMGPTGPDAARGDHYVLERWRERGDGNIVTWLGEHEQIGLPTADELASLLRIGRVTGVKIVGVYNLELWRTMHRALLGDYAKPRGDRFLHHLLWAPFGFLARRYRRGPFYRQLVVAEVGVAPSRA
jgi:SAM-dependent methyltransferase